MSPLLDDALDLAERLATAVEEGRVDLGDLGRRARRRAREDGEAGRARTALLTQPTRAGAPADFFARSVHEVAPDLIGVTLLVDGVGGRIVEVEAYDQEDPGEPRASAGETARNAVMFGAAGPRVRLPLVRHPLVPELRLRRPGRAEAVLIRALEPTHGSM